MLDAKQKVQYKSGMANVLPLAKRVQILNMLVEGSSMRAISRVAGVSFNTVNKLLVDAGETCLDLHDQLVTHVKSNYVQCDEIWSFCYAKQKNVSDAKAAPDGAGDVWTWTAIDADSKLMVAYFVGDRGGESAMILMDDLRARLSNPRSAHHGRPQGISGSRGRRIRRGCGLRAACEALRLIGRQWP